MPRVLAQAGTSLADVYDVEGSVAGVEELLSRDVQLLHEMGGTVFSERASAAIRLRTTGAIAQNTSWDLAITELPAGMSRVLSAQIISDSARVDHASLHIVEPIVGREVAFWAWDTNDDPEVQLRTQLDSVVSEVFLLRPSSGILLPNFLVGDGQPQIISDMAFRGVTTAFGAGTVTVQAMIHIAFSQVGGVSSRGLPVPSW